MIISPTWSRNQKNNLHLYLLSIGYSWTWPRNKTWRECISDGRSTGNLNEWTIIDWRKWKDKINKWTEKKKKIFWSWTTVKRVHSLMLYVYFKYYQKSSDEVVWYDVKIGHYHVSHFMWTMIWTKWSIMIAVETQ